MAVAACCRVDAHTKRDDRGVQRKVQTTAVYTKTRKKRYSQL